ncbi:MAG: adenylate kinase [Gemmatimonadota bacterium]|nr:MAG: adenylate kinase [Gemmatimonadota bacterium]
MYVILLGPPGVGKGTQGVLLADAHGMNRIVTGDLLRSARAEGTPLGLEAEQYMDAGELVPDGVMNAMVKECLESLPAERGVVFDGFPRTDGQATALHGTLEELGRRIDHVIVIEADNEVLVRRIAGRRSCPECGRVFNVYLNPPEREGVCDRDQSPLVHRADDEPETVRRRLEVYHELTEPLIAFYERSDATVSYVPGDQSVEDVQSSIESKIQLMAPHDSSEDA